MEHFRNAKVVRLLSHHNKYLTADDDAEDGVRQDRSGASRGAKWEVEVVEGRGPGVIRLKSCCFNRYLAASDKRFLLGATGKKVVLLRDRLGESVEWQPVRDGSRFVKLRSRGGTFLRANGLVKPYGNTVTHGNPHRTATQNWVLWEVDVVELLHTAEEFKPTPTAVPHVVVVLPSRDPAVATPATVAGPVEVQHQAYAAAQVSATESPLTSSHYDRSSSAMSDDSMSSCVSEEEDSGTLPPSQSQRPSFNIDSTAQPTPLSSQSSTKITVVPPAPQSPTRSNSTVSTSSSPSYGSSPPSPVLTPRPSTLSQAPFTEESSDEGRLVQYFFADDDGEVDDTFGSGCFDFHGSTVQQLIHNLEEQTGLDDFILCKRDVINDRLYRLRLNASLPADSAPMTVFIVHPMSRVAKRLS